MLTIVSRRGVIELGFTLVLALAHAALCVVYAFPSLARGVYAPTPGRVSVVTYIDQAGPVFTIGFGVTAVLLIVGVFRPWLLPTMHAVSGGFMAIFVAALWFGFAASDPRPSVLTALGYTVALCVHVVLVVTYSTALSLTRRTGGGHRTGGEAPR